MSIETWEKEFYPIPASKATSSELEAARHSLQKWKGYLPKNIEKHNLLAPALPDTSSGYCALCWFHTETRYVDNPNCKKCIVGGCGVGSAWALSSKFNPQPMIAELEKAVKKLEQHNSLVSFLQLGKLLANRKQ